MFMFIIFYLSTGIMCVSEDEMCSITKWVDGFKKDVDSDNLSSRKRIELSKYNKLIIDGVSTLECHQLKKSHAILFGNNAFDIKKYQTNVKTETMKSDPPNKQSKFSNKENKNEETNNEMDKESVSNQEVTNQTPETNGRSENNGNKSINSDEKESDQRTDSERTMKDSGKSNGQRNQESKVKKEEKVLSDETESETDDVETNDESNDSVNKPSNDNVASDEKSIPRKNYPNDKIEKEISQPKKDGKSNVYKNQEKDIETHKSNSNDNEKTVDELKSNDEMIEKVGGSEGHKTSNVEKDKDKNLTDSKETPIKPTKTQKPVTKGKLQKPKTIAKPSAKGKTPKVKKLAEKNVKVTNDTKKISEGKENTNKKPLKKNVMNKTGVKNKTRENDSLSNKSNSETFTKESKPIENKDAEKKRENIKESGTNNTNDISKDSSDSVGKKTKNEDQQIESKSEDYTDNSVTCNNYFYELLYHCLAASQVSHNHIKNKDKESLKISHISEGSEGNDRDVKGEMEKKVVKETSLKEELTHKNNTSCHMRNSEKETLDSEESDRNIQKAKIVDKKSSNHVKEMEENNKSMKKEKENIQESQLGKNETHKKKAEMPKEKNVTDCKENLNKIGADRSCRITLNKKQSLSTVKLKKHLQVSKNGNFFVYVFFQMCPTEDKFYSQAYKDHTTDNKSKNLKVNTKKLPNNAQVSDKIYPDQSKSPKEMNDFILERKALLEILKNQSRMLEIMSSMIEIQKYNLAEAKENLSAAGEKLYAKFESQFERFQNRIYQLETKLNKFHKVLRNCLRTKNQEKYIEKNIEKETERNAEINDEKRIKKSHKNDIEENIEKNIEKDIEKDIVKDSANNGTHINDDIEIPSSSENKTNNDQTRMTSCSEVEGEDRIIEIILNENEEKLKKEVICRNRSMVILQRISGKVNFTQPWNQYKYGFGDLSDSFWIGLEVMHRLMQKDRFKLIVDIQDWDNRSFYAIYDRFEISSESDGYRLLVDSFHGNSGDSLSSHNETKFSTVDTDNDNVSVKFGGSCSKRFRGGWWYYSCYKCNPTGVYYNGGKVADQKFDGISWKTLRSPGYSFQKIVMRIQSV